MVEVTRTGFLRITAACAEKTDSRGEFCENLVISSMQVELVTGQAVSRCAGPPKLQHVCCIVVKLYPVRKRQKFL